jgi:hypothetical protein
MRTTFYINLILFILAITSLFFNGCFVYIALIPLGFVEVISGLYVVSKRNILSEQNQKLIAIYFFTILVWVLSLLLVTSFHLDIEFLAILMGIIPIILSIYFMFILFKFQNTLCSN